MPLLEVVSVFVFSTEFATKLKLLLRTIFFCVGLLLFSACNFFKLGLAAKTPTTTVTVPSVTNITSGVYHSCTLMSGGTVQCWGINSYGQLGNGSTAQSTTPVTVSGVTGASAVAAGGYNTCVIVNGAALCWGYNAFGQVGNSTAIDSSTPVNVTGLTSGVTQISVGYDHSCAVVNSGAYCWGYNAFGQLGNNTLVNSTAPVQVLNAGLTPLTGVQAISAGFESTCAIVNGGVQCWGNNSNGQLGNNTTVQSSTPVSVLNAGLSAVSGAQSIQVGNFYACATLNGAVDCWGSNSNGQLGDGTLTDRLTATAALVVTGGVTSLSLNGSFAGGLHTCAIMSGVVYCWGYNSDGQLGNNTITDSLTPVSLSAQGLGSGSLAISTGGFHSCALNGSGVTCWGLGVNGQLGNGSTTEVHIPTSITKFYSGLMQVVQGFNHSCALTSGIVKCWGANASGQLGDGTVIDQSTPVSVVGLSSGVQAIAAGNGFTCALVNGGVKCWGLGTSGQLGNNTGASSSTPVDVKNTAGVATLTNVQAISAGTGSHICAITNGSAVCWGSDSNGQLGNSTSGTQSNYPAQVTGLTSGAQMISAGTLHTCAVVNGAASCWGANASGQIGDNTLIDKTSPTSPSGGATVSAGVSSISAGGSHSCALVAGASICWGANANGQIGDTTTTTPRKVPTASTGVAGSLSAISVGTAHSCAIIDGAAKCWGAGTNGELGNNGTADSASAIQTTGLTANVFQISSGNNSTCTLYSGYVSCYGMNGHGQLGIGTLIDSLIATIISGP